MESNSHSNRIKSLILWAELISTFLRISALTSFHCGYGRPKLWISSEPNTKITVNHFESMRKKRRLEKKKSKTKWSSLWKRAGRQADSQTGRRASSRRITRWLMIFDDCFSFAICFVAVIWPLLLLLLFAVVVVVVVVNCKMTFVNEVSW